MFVLFALLANPILLRDHSDTFSVVGAVTTLFVLSIERPLCGLGPEGLWRGLQISAHDSPTEQDHHDYYRDTYWDIESFSYHSSQSALGHEDMRQFIWLRPLGSAHAHSVQQKKKPRPATCRGGLLQKKVRGQCRVAFHIQMPVLTHQAREYRHGMRFGGALCGVEVMNGIE